VTDPPTVSSGADSPADAAALAAYATVLADGVADALPTWVRRVCLHLLGEAGVVADAALQHRIDDAAARAQEEVGGAVRELLNLDIDEQPTNPLAVVRFAVRYPTEVLRAAGVPPVVRPDFAERAFPDDIYDLSPATFTDLDPSLHEPGLVWGAAKAHVHLTRRRAEGRR
jgi:hypothetical protein